MSFITIALFPIIENTLVGTVSFLEILFTNGLVAKIRIAEDITNTAVCIIKFDVKKLTIIVSKAAIPNQKIKNPTVIISPTKNTPAAISQNCHIKIPPFHM